MSRHVAMIDDADLAALSPAEVGELASAEICVKLLGNDFYKDKVNFWLGDLLVSEIRRVIERDRRVRVAITKDEART